MRDELRENAEHYCKRNRLVLGDELGSGVQGTVFATFFQSIFWHSAIKAHEHVACYQRERDVYLRLRELDIATLQDCAVPELIAFDDELKIIEMTVVQPPYILDFAGAFLDFPPDFDEEVMTDWERERKEDFGDRWPDVIGILCELEANDIYLTDVHSRNICFG